MNAALRWALAGTALCALAAVLCFVALVPRELALDTRAGAALSPRLERALAALPAPPELVWFGQRADELPAAWRALPGEVRRLFAALERRGARTRVFLPEEDEGARDFAVRIGLTPLTARTVSADGWTDQPLWSALRLTSGPSRPLTVPALTPELATELDALVAAHLEALVAPRRARVAVNASDQFLRLRTLLGTGADVFDDDFERTARIAPETDLVLWLEPRALRAEHLAALDRHLASGGSAWIAAPPSEAEIQIADGQPRLRTRPPDATWSNLVGHFGLRALEGLLLDPRSRSARAAPTLGGHTLRVASIGEDQDFRALSGEPNGTLFFDTPRPVEPVLERLAELGLAPRVLASSGSASRLLNPGTEALSGAEAERALARARQGALPLLVELSPDDPWRGALLVSASSSVFTDRALEDRGGPHAALAQVLARELASSERALRHALAREQRAPLVELPDAARSAWRAGVVLAPALALLALGVWSARRRTASWGTPSWGVPRASWILLLAVPSLCAAGLLSRSVGPAAVDLSAGALHTLPEILVERARAAQAQSPGAALELECAFSPEAELPPELVPLARHARARAEALARRVPGLRVTHSAPEGPVDPAQDALALRITSVQAERTRVKHVHASLLLRGAGRGERIDLDRPELEHELDFRLAFAFERLARQHAVRLAFAAGEERLSPAEALLEYERQGRFAPRPGTRFGRARATLAAAGYELVDVDPESPVLPADCRGLVWLAPRREVGPLGVLLADHLAAGGRAFVALQQLRARPERRAESGAALTFWPEPQFPDLDAQWLPRLGIALPRELFADPRSARAPFQVKHEQAGRRSRFAREELGGPLVVRAAAVVRAAGIVRATAAREDLVLPLPTRIEADRARLAQHGLSVETLVQASAAATSRAWSGGALTPAELERPFADARPNAALCVLLRGRFPGAALEPAWGADAQAPAATDGALLLCGSSEAFTDELLAAHPANERFLLQQVAALTLSPELAALAGRAPTSAGLDPLPGATRAFWRTLLTVLVPLALLLAGLACTWRLRTAPARFREVAR